MKKILAGFILVLVLCNGAFAFDMHIDWGAAGDYIKGLFTSTSKDTPKPEQQETLPGNIAQDWDKLTGTLNDAMTLREKQEALPGWTWMPFGEDKSTNAAKINALLDEALNILSDGEAAHARKTANALNAAISHKREELDALRNRKITAPDKSYLPWKLTKEEADKKISALEAEIDDDMKSLDEINAQLAETLNDLGLELDGTQVEVLLSSVTGDDLLRNAVVFANVREVVTKLESLAQTGTNTLDITKRYTGMYLVLNDLLIHTQEELLRKIDGEYNPKLNTILTNAQALRREALTKSNQDIYTMQQRRAFAANAESNAITIQVARLYLELLNSQRDAAERHVKSLKLNRDLAENTYKTVRSSGELKGLIRSGLSAFDAVESLTMPELKIFENGEMRSEFEEINRRLKR